MSLISPYERLKISIDGWAERKRVRCWFMHDWSKWSVMYRGITIMTQQKECLNCGKVKVRTAL